MSFASDLADLKVRQWGKKNRKRVYLKVAHDKSTVYTPEAQDVFGNFYDDIEGAIDDVIFGGNRPDDFIFGGQTQPVGKELRQKLIRTLQKRLGLSVKAVASTWSG